MTKSEAKPAIAAVNELFSKSPDGLGEIVLRGDAGVAGSRDDRRARGRERRAHRSPGSVTAPAITAAPSSPGWASSSCACRRTETGGSRPNSSNAISAPSRRSWRRWPRCTCRASRPGRSRRSPRNCAATPSRPRPSPPSTSAWTRASTPSPSAPLPSLSLTSSSTPAMRRCARAAWS